jgi:hypothetical protein
VNLADKKTFMNDKTPYYYEAIDDNGKPYKGLVVALSQSDAEVIVKKKLETENKYGDINRVTITIFDTFER